MIEGTLSWIKRRVLGPMLIYLGVSRDSVERLRIPWGIRYWLKGGPVWAWVQRRRWTRPAFGSQPDFGRFEALFLLLSLEAVRTRSGDDGVREWIRLRAADMPSSIRRRAARRAMQGLASGDLEQILDWTDAWDPVARNDIRLAVADAYWTQGDGVSSVDMLISILGDMPDDFLRRQLLNRLNELGEIRRPLRLMREWDDDPHFSEDSLRFRRLLARKRLLEEGYALPEPTHHPIERSPKTILYLLHNSLPYASGGYATRTHGLCMGLSRDGWEMNCLTRAGYPADIENLPRARVPASEVIDGITYRRILTEQPVYGAVDQLSYLDTNSERVAEVARRLKPRVLHAASNHINGLAAAYSGRALGIPSIYEVRGLWELTRISRQPDFERSELYEQIVGLETQACREVDHVLTITEALKRLLVRRGIEEQKITVVPNGVDPQRFHPVDKDDGLAERLGIKGKVVLGFIGSMPQYEGLEVLLYALRYLMEAGRKDFHFLAVGDGTELEGLQSVATDLGLEPSVTFVGRVPHHEVERYYSVVDICIYPRKDQPVCHLVSPLKPFEAMAMKKAVIASDVAALGEIVSHEKTGLLHRSDDVHDLARCISILLDDPELREDLGARAREWVLGNRDWRVLAEKVSTVYSRIS